MTYYSVLAVTPTNEEWIPDYIEPVTALVAQHGGKYVARTSSHARLEGEGEDAALRVIIEWPSKEAVSNSMGPLPVTGGTPPGKQTTTSAAGTTFS